MARLLVTLIIAFQVSSAWALAGTIQNILGTAKIHKKTGHINPAIRNDQLYEGDTVIAENASNVQIRMIDGAIIWLRANSEFKIDTYKSKKNGSETDESSLKLLTGSMRTVTGLIGKQNPDGYKLSTPNATIGVRGTEYDAVFVPPSATAQFRADSGTYHRVFQGTTQFKAGGKDQRIDEGQTVFASLSNPEAAKKLSDIPSFLNLPPNSTLSTAPVVDTSPVVTPAVPLLLSVRYGNPDELAISSKGRAAASKVFTARLDSGKQVLLLGQVIFGDLLLQVGKDNIDSTKYNVAIKATTNASSDNVQLSFGEVQNIGKPGSTLSYKLSLDLSMGTWTEVSNKGPWQSKSSGNAGIPASVFVMINTAR